MRLLIVDDSKLSRLMLKAIVEDVIPDAEVLEASNGEEALDQVAKAESVDKVIADFNMPGMTGLELLAKLEGQIQQSALLTANIQPHIQAEAESMGVTFLNKPINEQTVKPFITSPL